MHMFSSEPLLYLKPTFLRTLKPSDTMAVMQKIVREALCMVDNSHLDQMNDALWREASSFSASSFAPHNSPIISGTSPNSDAAIILSPESNESQILAKRDAQLLEEELKRMSLVSVISNKLSLRNHFALSNLASPWKPSEWCTMNLDMTVEDRKRLQKDSHEIKSEYQCEVDFFGQDSKVSIHGLVSNVHMMCDFLIRNTTQSLDVEVELFEEKAQLYGPNFICYTYIEPCPKVYISIRPITSKKIQCSFSTLRNYGYPLTAAIKQVWQELDLSKAGVCSTSISSSMTIPASRSRDLTGRANLFIEQVELQTSVKIEITKSNDNVHCPLDYVKITGSTIESVNQARTALLSRFTAELKFTVFIDDTRPLVEYISKLSQNHKDVYISIEPSQFGPECKTISIVCPEYCAGGLFQLREKLLEQVEKCNASRVQYFYSL